MKKFKFRLQKLLEIRVKKEDLAKQAFSKAQKQLEMEIAKKESLIHDLAKEQNNLKEKRKSGSLVSSEEASYKSYFIRLNNMITDQQLTINQTMNEVEKRREELIEASKEKKVLESLKEKKYEEYLFEANMEEQKFLDELATMGSSRKKDFE